MSGLVKKKIRLGFCDFDSNFNPRENYFVRILRDAFDLEITDQPDFLIFSVFGDQYKRFKGTRIFFTGECVHPDTVLCDYSFSFDYLDRPGHFRLPLYCLYFHVNQLIKPPDFAERALAQKSKFCIFVASNPKGVKRNQFFEKLSKYKQVDSGGRYKNNIGGPLANKMAALPQYKFTIAFENTEYPGYTTEKIAEPLVAGSVPIYWGNPLVERDFNPRSFVNYYDYGSDEAVIERIMELDRNDDLYAQMLAAPSLKDNIPNALVNRTEVLAQFERIFSQPLQYPVARSFKAIYPDRILPIAGRIGRGLKKVFRIK